jgi:hypothetical protein
LIDKNKIICEFFLSCQCSSNVFKTIPENEQSPANSEGKKVEKELKQKKKHIQSA